MPDAPSRNDDRTIRLPDLRPRLPPVRSPTLLLGCLPSGGLACPPAGRSDRPDPARSPRPATVYECPACETRYLGEQRCPDCHLFCRRIGPGGACPHCDEPVALVDLYSDSTTTTGRSPIASIVTPTQTAPI